MSSTILVVTGERQWTLRALHLAAAMAREASLPVVIAHMVPVAHLEYLGAGTREELLSFEAYDDLSNYLLTVDAYGVPVRIELFEYSDYNGGVTSASDLYEAAVVFAPAPTGIIETVARWRLWALRRMVRRPLYVLGHGDGPPAWTEDAETAANVTVAQPSMSIHNL